MALISDLVSAIAEAEGLPEATVQLVARYIREAGHLSQGARGRNAPQATVTDCANLLIAVNAGGCVVKDAPEAVDQFRNLVIHDPHGSALNDVFQYMDRSHNSATFAEILEGTIHRFIGNELPDFFFKSAADYVPSKKYKTAFKLYQEGKESESLNQVAEISNAIRSLIYLGTVSLRIEFHRPNPSAQIYFEKVTEGATRETLAGAHFIMHVNDAMKFKVSDGDMRERRTIGFNTMLKVAEVMRL